MATRKTKTKAKAKKTPETKIYLAIEGYEPSELKKLVEDNVCYYVYSDEAAAKKALIKDIGADYADSSYGILVEVRVIGEAKRPKVEPEYKEIK